MTIRKKTQYLIFVFIVIIAISSSSIFYGVNDVINLNNNLQNDTKISNEINKIKYTIKTLQENSIKYSLSTNDEKLRDLFTLKKTFEQQIIRIKTLELNQVVKKSVQNLETGFNDLFNKLLQITTTGINKEESKKLSHEKLTQFIYAVNEAKETVVELYGILVRNNVTKMQTQIATMESSFITVLASGNDTRLATAKLMSKKMLRTLKRAKKRNPKGALIIQKQIGNIKKLSKVGNNLALYGIDYLKFTKQQEKNLEITNEITQKYFNDLNILSKKLEKSVNNKLSQNNDSLSHLVFIAMVSTILSIIFLILLWIISKSIIYNITRLSTGVTTLMSFTSADQKIDINSEDEIAELAQAFNTYMKNSRTTMIQDQKIVEEAEKAIQMAKSGFFVYTIQNSSTNRSTNDLKNAVNEMIHDLNDKFTTINQALIEYGNTNFDYQLDVKDASGTIGSIVSGTKAIGSNVSELLATIMISGEKLSSNIDILSHASNSLSNSANSQAASLEQTAASVEKITLKNKENTQNIVTMSELADNLTATSNEGKKLALQTSKSMEEIEQKVSSISEAISIIDTIAFQTNILSLNAAVEAATAGEAGKGFAVVAQEVRNLANRSAQAASDIKNLVNSATAESTLGKTISTNMITGYNELDEKITQTKEIIDFVTTASIEQEKGMSQINDVINALDQTTQENASNASSIHNLSIEVQELSNKLIDVANYSKYDQNAREQVCDVDYSNKLNQLKLSHIAFKENCFDRLHEEKSFTINNKNKLGLWIKETENSNSNVVYTTNWKNLKNHYEVSCQKIQEYINENASNATNENLLRIANEIEDSTNIVFKELNTIKALKCKEKAS